MQRGQHFAQMAAQDAEIDQHAGPVKRCPGTGDDHVPVVLVQRLASAVRETQLMGGNKMVAYKHLEHARQDTAYDWKWKSAGVALRAGPDAAGWPIW